MKEIQNKSFLPVIFANFLKIIKDYFWEVLFFVYIIIIAILRIFFLNSDQAFDVFLISIVLIILFFLLWSILKKEKIDKEFY